MCTEPADQKNAEVYSKLHQWRVPYDNGLCPEKHVVDVLACFFETLFFVIATYIGFYDADCGYIFLYTFIQIIVFFERFLKVVHGAQ